jgi:hypothetical protein
MAQDDDKLVKIADDSAVLDAVAERLAASESPQDVVLWTQVRGEILRQNEEAENRRHQRQMEKIQLYGKISLSIVALGVGILLLKFGYTTAGYFALGAGMFWLAPDFVKAFFDKFKTEK